MEFAEREVRRDERGKDSTLDDRLRCTRRSPSKGHGASP